MDLIFQSGDFYNQTNSIWSNLINIVSALLGALISGLIAIYIFKKGLRNEEIKKKNEYKSESNDLEMFLFHNIYSLNFFIEKQIKEISNCSKNLKDWNNCDFSLSIFPELTTKDIFKISQEKIYKIFVTDREGDLNEKVNDFINLRNSFYNIDAFIESENELNKEVFQRQFVNIELWNQSLKSLLDLSNTFVLSYNSNPVKGKDDFLELYTNLFVNKQRELIKENKNNNMVIVFEELIKPLKNYLKENKQSNDMRLLMISNPIMNIQKAYTEISNLRYEKRKRILISGRRLLKIKRLINQSIQRTKLRNKKL